MNEILKIHEDRQFPIDGHELHEQLGIDTRYSTWFPRMCEYGFAEGSDYEEVLHKNVQNPAGGRPEKNHNLTLSMAKELCMLQRTETGRTIRRYLIEVENAWNTPEQVMARALRVAEETISKLTGSMRRLEATNSELAVEKQIMAPKADYFDQIVERNLLTNFRETAKQLSIKERVFVNFLLEHKYIYRDKRGRLMPYEKKNDGFFEIKESINEKTNWSGTQTLITPKGRETFRLLMQGMQH